MSSNFFFFCVFLPQPTASQRESSLRAPAQRLLHMLIRFYPTPEFFALSILAWTHSTKHLKLLSKIRYIINAYLLTNLVNLHIGALKQSLCLIYTLGDNVMTDCIPCRLFENKAQIPGERKTISARLSRFIFSDRCALI